MVDAEENNSFYTANKKLKNLKELLEMLEDPSYADTARTHVSGNKNDFSNWIKDVLKEDELAEKISKEKDISVIADIIRKGIKHPSSADLAALKEVDTADLTNPLSIEINNYEEEKKKLPNDDHLKKETEHHKTVLKKAEEPRHFCPKFFHCMRKEFMFGFALGIIVGIVIAIFIKIGAI